MSDGSVIFRVVRGARRLGGAQGAAVGAWIVINQVVVAGTIVDGPHRSEAGFPAVEMRLALQSSPRYERGQTRHSEVRVRLFGEKQTEVVMRYMAKGRAMMFTGHLEWEGIDLIVIADQFQFMSDGTISRGLFSPPSGVRPAAQLPAQVAAA